MRKISIGLAAIIALSASACASVYSDIRKNDDGSYLVTKTSNSFFQVYGEVYSCKPEGNEKLVCKSIDRL